MVGKTRNRFTINVVIFAHTHVIHTMVDHSVLQYHVYTIQFTGMVTGRYKVATYRGNYMVSVFGNYIRVVHTAKNIHLLS